MDKVIENLPILEESKTPKEEKSFSFNKAISELRQGNRSNSDVKKLIEIAPLISRESAEPMIEYLIKQEGLSPEFSSKMLSDTKLMQRVVKLAGNFAENGERMLALEEAEIYCDLFGSDRDDISVLLQSANLSRKFTNLKALDRQDTMAEQLNTLRQYLLGDIGDSILQQELITDIQGILDTLGLGSMQDKNTWIELAHDQEKFNKFYANRKISDIYSAVMDDREIKTLGRGIELFWRKETTGSEPVPAMRVEKFARNPETGAVSRFAYDIEKEYIILPDGNKKSQRVVKNLEIVIDQAARGTNQGPEFLLSLLPLCKEYGIDEVEFVANMKIGSYLWTRISDIDALATLQNMAPHERTKLGNSPDDEKKAKGIIMTKYMLPKYESNMAAAISSVLKGIKDPKKKKETEDLLVRQFMEKEYGALKQRAVAGEVTMEDLANLGKGFELINFDEDGKIVPQGDSRAVHHGHLGKAAIMGIPWKTRIKTDRDSLFALIDKLHTGTGAKSSFMRLAMKIGVFFKAPKAKV